jgi:sugar O-acyltransferase (sialic acid O-acetyltransferase NeuD family)
MSQPVIVIGAGGHACVLLSILKSLQCEIIGILSLDDAKAGQSIAGIPILGNDDKIFEYSPDSVGLVNGIGSVSSMENRKVIYEKFKEWGYLFATVIHPSAVVADDLHIGEGAQIMAGAIVQTGCAIGYNSIINSGAIVDHHCKIGNHTHISPGAVLSGGVQVDDMVHIGTAATIIQGITIGEHTLVGAGSVVINNMPAGVRAFGVPAKVRNS